MALDDSWPPKEGCQFQEESEGWEQTDREQMPVASREMRRADDRQTTDATLCRDIADPALAPRTRVPDALELGVAGAQPRQGRVNERGEPHEHQVGRVGRCRRGGRGQGLRSRERGRRRHELEQELS